MKYTSEKSYSVNATMVRGEITSEVIAGKTYRVNRPLDLWGH